MFTLGALSAMSIDPLCWLVIQGFMISAHTLNPRAMPADVYLGAPCAVPVDPRHRLVVPKYNPARTVTPEGAVGIGGCYMCIYPMESPGGYQLVRSPRPMLCVATV